MLRIEPSALTGFLGPIITSNKYDKNTIHICWGTGGSLVPEEDRKEFLGR